MSQVESKPLALGFALPDGAKPAGNYVGMVMVGQLIFVSGHGCRAPNGQLLVGRLGDDVDVTAGAEAARHAALNCLGTLKRSLGDLDRVTQIVKLFGMVNSAPGFHQQPKVIDGASDLLVQVFGERGKHARSAVGMAELPMGMVVEIEMIVTAE